MERTGLEEKILTSFANVPPPKDQELVDGNDFESKAIEKIFHGVRDWRELHVFDMDSEPATLIFLSNTAFLYYLQAFMIHDLAGEVHNNDVVSCITSGFSDDDLWERDHPRHYGDTRKRRTRWGRAVHRCSAFSKEQVEAIIDYLRFKLEEEPDGFDAPSIRQAIENYWSPRLGELRGDSTS
ncbi:DUF6714 family protein [Ralstonia soli]|uniref:Uncharacterized protein n=1 Tax=Ralstonia soli TaxID=2953896 RepID=A0ABT1ANL1_9RALS|nr:DUF6714 family protein [Ralstonia soli]MCO5400026.1 hypothetical protein [Ralstonia soli]